MREDFSISNLINLVLRRKNPMQSISKMVFYYVDSTEPCTSLHKIQEVDNKSLQL
jgi:hypothetical protein